MSFDTDWEDRKKKRDKFKKMVTSGIVLIFTIIISFYISIAYFAMTEIDENGGVKNTIIKFGKELKDISVAIDADGK